MWKRTILADHISPYTASRSATAPKTGSTPTRELLRPDFYKLPRSQLNSYSTIQAALDLHVDETLPIHPALRPHLTPAGQKRRVRSVILEAEVVPYNQRDRQGGRGPGIEEFWWLGVAGVSGCADL